MSTKSINKQQAYLHSCTCSCINLGDTAQLDGCSSNGSSLSPSYTINEINQQKNSYITSTELENLMNTLLSESYCESKYYTVLYQCMIYVRKHGLRTLCDDGRIFECIENHIKIGLDPQPLSSIGRKIMKNGYFLVAYALTIGRIYHSYELVVYLLHNFICHYEIQEHQQELTYYFSLFESDPKLQREFQVPSDKSTAKSKKR